MTTAYKAIISDFDGTLVGEDLVLSPRLIRAVSALRSQGWHFCIATGRMRTTVIETALKELNIQDPAVLNGGAEIIDPVSGKVLLQYTMPIHVVKELIRSFEGTEGTPFIHKGDYMYIDEPEKLPSHRKYICRPLSELDMNGLLKVRVIYPAGKGDDMAMMLKQLVQTFPELHFGRSDSPSGPGCDITSAGATKHQAVLHLSEMIGVHPSHIIGIGDGYNDYPLLTACGLKVAVETAPPELMGIADKVIPSQKTEGVAAFLESLIE